MTTASNEPADTVATLTQASRLLAEGRLDEARELLLVEAYVKRDEPTLQATYLNLIPPTPTLLEIQAESYDDLRNPDAKVRLKAATRITRECSKVYPRHSVRWMRDPRATAPLMQSATSDPDAKVADKTLHALACILCAYFPDQRALPVLLSRLKDTRQEARASAISGLGCLRREELLDHFVDLLERGTTRDRELVIGTVSGLAYETEANLRQLPMQWTVENRRRWVARMVVALGDEAASIRRPAAVALKCFMDPSALPALRAARPIETDATIAYFIDDAIKTLEALG
jgi:HEAT repeats